MIEVVEHEPPASAQPIQSVEDVPDEPTIEVTTPNFEPTEEEAVTAEQPTGEDEVPVPKKRKIKISLPLNRQRGDTTASKKSS